MEEIPTEASREVPKTSLIVGSGFHAYSLSNAVQDMRLIPIMDQKKTELNVMG